MKTQTAICIYLCLLLLNACDRRTISLQVISSGEILSEFDITSSFSSLNEAINRARVLKNHDISSSISINLQPGEHYLSSPIVITSDLNGLTIRASGTSEVVVKGSTILDLEWEKYDENIFTAQLQIEKDFDQLIVNGSPQILARYPDYNEDGGYWQGHAADAISKERIYTWKNPAGAYYHVMHIGRWGGFHYQITGLDENGDAILEGGHQNNRPSRPHETFRMVENVLEELTSAGEWYFDKSQSKLYFWPPDEIDIQSAKIEVPIVKNLISIKGKLNKPVRNISIEGIKFEHTNRTFLEEYEPLLRSDWTIYRGGALFIEGSENCKISDCEFRNLGGNAIFASSYNNKLEINGNHIYNCGASGICLVGDPSAVRSPSFQYGKYVNLKDMDTISGPRNELYPRNCIVKNNLIYRIGRLEKQTAGVEIAMAMDITVSHNSIYEVPRAGINIGDGTWGGHMIEYNDVFNTVLETGDHGSFNSWGRDRFWHPNRKLMDSITLANPKMPYWDAIHTTVIHDNRFRCDHGWDIDLDDGSSNYHIYNNLCLNRGLKLREGFSRTVENNILVNNAFHPHVWFENSGDIFRHNILGDAHQDIRLNGWGKKIDYNLFPNEISLLQANVYDVDKNSIWGNPMFINPNKMDFRVAENSPALEIGFKNFDMDKFGVQDPKLKGLAKTPEIPELKTDSEENISPIISWFQIDLKGIENEVEASAYGLSSAEGIVVLKIGRGSKARASGLQEGDVILSIGQNGTKNLSDFFRIQIKLKGEDKAVFVVMRDQKEEQLIIDLK